MTRDARRSAGEEDGAGATATTTGSVNLEVKARDVDTAATARACLTLGAVEELTMRQRDTYFAVPCGRLKLREDMASGSAELIAYERPSADGVRASRYWRVDVLSPRPLRELLGRALGILGTVHKTRRLFMFRHVRIHLDEVEGLGSFIELEAVLPAGGQPPPRDDSLDEVMGALQLHDRPTISDGYLELLLAQDRRNESVK